MYYAKMAFKNLAKMVVINQGAYSLKVKMNKSSTAQENDCIQGNEQIQDEMMQVWNLLSYSSWGSCYHFLSQISRAKTNAVEDDDLVVSLFINIIIIIVIVIHLVVIISLAIRSSNQHRDYDYEFLLLYGYGFMEKASETMVTISRIEQVVSGHRN